jgi:four helix bundle protein
MLRIYQFALETLVELRPALEGISQHDPDLARQLRRACTSMVRNLAEGAGGRGGTRRARYYDALGSTRESAACLDAANALASCAIDSALRDRFERVAAMLVNVVR